MTRTLARRVERLERSTRPVVLLDRPVEELTDAELDALLDEHAPGSVAHAQAMTDAQLDAAIDRLERPQ